MNQTNKYALTFETLAELSSEIRSAHVDPASALPKLSEVLAEISPLPRGSTFLGMANDGLPVLLNLLDPRPGPLLIAGDRGSGKTKLLQVVSQSIAHVPASYNIRYVVLTNYPDEWRTTQFCNCEGVLSMTDPASAGYLAKLAKWAHAGQSDPQIFVLLIDDFETLLSLNEIRQYMRWLLLRGPSHQVWPFITLNSERVESLASWLGGFRTRLFGHIEDSQTSRILAGTSESHFKDLLLGSQFSMKEGESWLPFWIPRLD